jgi:hypothetical protein
MLRNRGHNDRERRAFVRWGRDELSIAGEERTYVSCCNVDFAEYMGSEVEVDGCEIRVWNDVFGVIGNGKFASLENIEWLGANVVEAIKLEVLQVLNTRYTNALSGSWTVQRGSTNSYIVKMCVL